MPENTALRTPGPVPAEALRYFENKGFKTSFNHRDVWREEHAFAFTVAKAMKMDVLTEIRGALRTALEEGQTLEQFKKELTPKLRKLGWWGRKNLKDPVTGELVDAQLGSPRRLRVIYRANMKSARAAGQWERAQRTKDALPYFLYNLGPSREHRDEHVAVEGTILPIDDPFWDTWAPPNGWGCKCWLRQVSAREADSRGGVSSRAGVPTRRFTNQRTGETVEVPEGVHPDWSTNPGKLRQENLQRLLTDKLENAEPILAQVAVRDLVRSPALGHFLENPRGEFPMLRLPDAAAEAIGARHKVAVMSGETAAKQLRRHGELALADYERLPDLGEHAQVIVRDTDQSVVLVRRAGDRIDWGVVKATRTGENTFITSFRRATEKDVQRLIRRGETLLGQWSN